MEGPEPSSENRDEFAQVFFGDKGAFYTGRDCFFLSFLLKTDMKFAENVIKDSNTRTAANFL